MHHPFIPSSRVVLRLLTMLHAVTYDQIDKCVLYMFCGHIANFLIVSLLEIFIPTYCLLTLGVRMSSEGYGSRSVCLFVCLSTTTLGPMATRWLMIDTNIFSATRA